MKNTLLLCLFLGAVSAFAQNSVEITPQNTQVISDFAGNLFRVINNNTGPSAGISGSTVSLSAGVGVKGFALATSPSSATYGLYGSNAATNNSGYGVYGIHASGGVGVFGVSDSGVGVSALSTSGNAINATSTSGMGVVGNSIENHGIKGETNANSNVISGVMGIADVLSPSTNTSAVHGHNNSTNNWGYGVWGTHAGSGAGVSGTTDDGFGVYGASLTKYGIYGYSNSGAAGFFTAPNGYALITGNGNVGIGISAPTEKLNVIGKVLSEGTVGGFRFNDRTVLNKGYQWYATGSNAYLARHNGADANVISVLENGNLGLGVDIPHATLHFKNIAQKRRVVLWETVDNDHQFYGLGVTTSTFHYQVNSTGASHVFFAAVNGTTSNELMRIKGDGNVIVAGTVTANGVLLTSDSRYKKDVSKLNASLTRISGLNGYQYNWKDEARGKGLQTGVIAQEVEKIFPELVSTDDKGYKSVNYIGFIPHLIESVKALKTENEQLKARLSEVDQLKAEMASLKSMLQQQQPAQGK